MGLLDGNLSPEDRAMLLTVGFGLLGTPRGQELQRLGQVGQMGLIARANSAAAQEQKKLRDLELQQHSLQLQQLQQSVADDQKMRDILGRFQMPAPLPSMSPTVANATALASTPKPGIYEQLQAKADALDHAGLPKQAEQYRTMAEKHAPQYEGTETVMDPQSGKPVLLQKYKNRAPEPMQYQPTAKFREVNRGGTVDVVNELALPQSGASYNVTMTPAQIEQNRIAQGHLQIARNADTRAAANEGQPQIVTTPDGLYAVSKQSGMGKPVVGPDGQPLMGNKPLTESQAKATVFANQMITASQKLAELEAKGFSGTGMGQQIALGLAGTNGVPFVPGSEAIARKASPKLAQEYDQAQKQWTEGFLRFQSGATITEQELRQGVKTYFPVTGNGPDVIAQKAAMRAQAERNMAAAAGAGKLLPQPSPVDALEAEIKRRGLAP